MTNNPDSRSVLTSPSAMSDMIEAREWLINPSDDVLSRNHCLSLISKDKDALVAELRHLWLRQEKNMRTTIGKHLKAVRGGKERQTRATRTHKLATMAMEVFNRSNRWVGA